MILKSQIQSNTSHQVSSDSEYVTTTQSVRLSPLTLIKLIHFLLVFQTLNSKSCNTFNNPQPMYCCISHYALAPQVYYISCIGFLLNLNWPVWSIKPIAPANLLHALLTLYLPPCCLQSSGTGLLAEPRYRTVLGFRALHASGLLLLRNRIDCFLQLKFTSFLQKATQNSLILRKLKFECIFTW